MEHNFKFHVQTNGLVDIHMDTDVAVDLVHELSSEIRKMSYPDIKMPSTLVDRNKGFGFDDDTFVIIHRMARLCHNLMANVSVIGGATSLVNLSKEDVELLYNHTTAIPSNFLTPIRNATRAAGPVGPIEADLMAKELSTILES